MDIGKNIGASCFDNRRIIFYALNVVPAEHSPITKKIDMLEGKIIMDIPKITYMNFVSNLYKIKK